MVLLEFIEMFLWPIYGTSFNVAIFVNIYSHFICTFLSLQLFTQFANLYVYIVFPVVVIFLNFNSLILSPQTIR